MIIKLNKKQLKKLHDYLKDEKSSHPGVWSGIQAAMKSKLSKLAFEVSANEKVLIDKVLSIKNPRPMSRYKSDYKPSEKIVSPLVIEINKLHNKLMNLARKYNDLKTEKSKQKVYNEMTPLTSQMNELKRQLRESRQNPISLRTKKLREAGAIKQDEWIGGNEFHFRKPKESFFEKAEKYGGQLRMELNPASKNWKTKHFYPYENAEFLDKTIKDKIVKTPGGNDLKLTGKVSVHYGVVAVHGIVLTGAEKGESLWINREQFLKQKKAPKKNPAKFDRCVKQVRRKSPGVNAYAVCQKTVGKGERKNPYKYQSIFDKNQNEPTPVQKELIRQLGGNRFFFMMGTSKVLFENNSIKFNVKSSDIKWVKIEYVRSKDSYNVAFYTGIKNLKLVKKVDDLYTAELINAIEINTGLYSKL